MHIKTLAASNLAYVNTGLKQYSYYLGYFNTLSEVRIIGSADKGLSLMYIMSYDISS